MSRPWGVHTIASVFGGPDEQMGLPDGRWVVAVCEPYTAGKLKAAWWVFTGRAFAFIWPKPGDLEDRIYGSVEGDRSLSPAQQAMFDRGVAHGRALAGPAPQKAKP